MALEWGTPELTHKLFGIYKELHDIAHWMNSPVLVLETKVLIALNNLLDASVKAEEKHIPDSIHDTLRLCIKCKWVKDKSIVPGADAFHKTMIHISPVCVHLNAPHSLYDGNPDTLTVCVRDDENKCGYDAKWFEPKE